MFICSVLRMGFSRIGFHIRSPHSGYVQERWMRIGAVTVIGCRWEGLVPAAPFPPESPPASRCPSRWTSTAGAGLGLPRGRWRRHQIGEPAIRQFVRQHKRLRAGHGWARNAPAPGHGSGVISDARAAGADPRVRRLVHHQPHSLTLLARNHEHLENLRLAAPALLQRKRGNQPHGLRLGLKKDEVGIRQIGASQARRLHRDQPFQFLHQNSLRAGHPPVGEQFLIRRVQRPQGHLEAKAAWPPRARSAA